MTDNKLIAPPITARDRRILSWIVLSGGLLLTAGGIFGVWVQGLFYQGGFPTAATFGEVQMAFTLPVATTTLGSMLVSWVVFVSSCTASWSPRKRVGVFICFGFIVMLGCVVCGQLATARVATILN